MALDAIVSYVREQAPDLSRGSIAATLFGIWLLYRIGLVSYRLFLDPLSKFPGPKFAAASSLYEMYYDIIEDGTLIWKMDELHEKYGPIVRISPHTLRLRKTSAYHEIHRMGTPFAKEYRYYQLFGIPGSTFSTIDMDLHRQRRSRVDPMFSRRGILDIEYIVKEKVDILCRRMKEHGVQDKFFNCHLAFSALALDIATEFSYAKNYDVLNAPDFACRAFDAWEAQHEVFLILKHFPLLSKIMQALPIWILLILMPRGAGFAELQMDAENNLKELFTRMRTGKMEKDPRRRTIFAEILAGHPDPANVDPTELTDEAMAVVTAGFHTTRWTMCVGLLEVSRDPLIQTKLYEELKMASPDINAEFSYLHCEKLPYLRGVILETLRISYGVIGALPRRVPKGGAVIGGYHLPGDSTIEMDNYSLHHDEEIFPDSHRFWPERWSSPESKQNEKYVNAFGAGPRQCLGINLALCELYLTFANIFRRFEIDTSARGTARMKTKDHLTNILRDEPLKCKVISRKD